jgi:RNA polymerase sigma-70 factor (ECF subfamily)
MSGDADAALGRLERARVLHGLGVLPAPQAEAILLASFGGLSHTEIAARLEVPVGTVKGRLRLGLHRLAGAMTPVPSAS